MFLYLFSGVSNKLYVFLVLHDSINKDTTYVQGCCGWSD